MVRKSLTRDDGEIGPKMQFKKEVFSAGFHQTLSVGAAGNTKKPLDEQAP